MAPRLAWVLTALDNLAGGHDAASDVMACSFR
jgi:hypothetical protein